ncbi:MAG: outer membrane beta-barrel protein [Elusimicrobia bacterium]|nr:outer membrane beta-barrel protein [Elusimicrobiota bacterium]
MNLYAIVAAALLALPAQAESGKPNIKLGQLALHPYYGISAIYDDNIYLVPKNEDGHAVAGGGVRGSWIMSNNLGLRADMPMGETQKLAASYDLRSDIYKAQSSANNAVTQKAGGAYDFKGARTKLRLSDDYVNTSDPAFNPNNTAVAGELVTREKRWNNAAGGGVEYFLGDKFFAGIDGAHSIQKYLSRSLGQKLNNYALSFGGRAGYKLLPKTRAYLGVHRSITHYSVTRDISDITETTAAGDVIKVQDHVANHKDWLVDAGVEGSIAPKVTGRVQGGYVYRRHDKDNSDARRRPISRNATVSVGVDYKPTERDTVKLTANRGLVDAVTGGNYYLTNGGVLDLSHKWDKITVGLAGGLQVDKYSEAITSGGLTANRRDAVYTGAARCEYRIQEWLAANLGYKNVSRFSNFSRQFNYKDNRTSAELRLSF